MNCPHCGKAIEGTLLTGPSVMQWFPNVNGCAPIAPSTYIITTGTVDRTPFVPQNNTGVAQ